ncbi:cyclic pyranopterin monophosphate synthase subunit MoaC [Natranaerovirga hydrolytica]|uniref:Cyclic pyranopterin monophosphate synthase n=1 Tax=Natranaerovirga hydrolytica TaxID=680378 RepID=A0A4R1MXC8_9FIRM|nr:cyclic pyranopterin monophosphate synthase MoaC [Natranaerovirga hydrolytica]TCK97745.1 cyclic pyranopterin monophosphate synthase subunit MoaC [Natranaerovirga hydrolytica]
MEWTHFNKEGRAKMVDVSDKKDTKRVAIARGSVKMKPSTVQRIKDQFIQKGDVLSVAQIAGVMGAKETSRLIPMCHPLFLTGVNLQFEFEDNGIIIESQVKTTGQTGVEMEALTAVSIASLTIYDMCKAIDQEMVIEGIKLIKKTGGKSGDFIREEC